TGSFYAFLAPFIGLLGCFMTGSNLASNLIFGNFQQATAHAAGLSHAPILAAQTAGGATGAMVAPPKVLLGTTTAGILGREGDVMRITFCIALPIAAVIGIIALIFV
ncbi:MAG: L-lactate permease, partial [Sciscionella sp.]